jgi:hypothetical protein
LSFFAILFTSLLLVPAFGILELDAFLQTDVSSVVDALGAVLVAMRLEFASTALAAH